MRWLRSERGDTLVEVTMALAILALVLTGAFTTANKAFSLGQDAKERSQLTSDAQQQAEALQSFRDSYKWSEFVAGRPVNSIPGINVQNGSGDCDASQAGLQTCFHMARQTVNGADQWVPVAGVGNDALVAGGLSYMWISAVPLVSGTGYNFTIVYGVPARGGGPDLRNTLWLQLVNLDRLRR